MVRKGYIFASVPALLGVLAFVLGWWPIAIVFLALAGFVLFFFRDPERAIPDVPGAIVSPADGRVLAVDEITRDAAPQTRVSIFLSLFDVHVNRAPIAGEVTTFNYTRGRFHIASRDAASRENEQTEVTIEGEGTCVVFKQIAGVLARRIEFWPPPGSRLARGQRVGMIRFGSRVEVFFEPRYAVRVRPGEHVRGGSTILAIRE